MQNAFHLSQLSFSSVELHQPGGVKAQALASSVHVTALSNTQFLHTWLILNYLGKRRELALYVRIFLCGWAVMNVFHWTELSALIHKARIQSIQKSDAFTTENVNKFKETSSWHKLCRKYKLCSHEIVSCGFIFRFWKLCSTFYCSKYLNGYDFCFALYYKLIWYLYHWL